MNKSLWYISKYFPPKTDTSYGGRGHSLMKEMSTLGYEISVISSDSNNLCEIPKFEGDYYTENKFGYKLVLLKTMKYKVAKSSRRILSWIHFEWNLFTFDTKILKKPDIVIVSSLSLLTIFYGLFLRKKFKCKLVFEVRDIWPLTIIEEGGFTKSNPFVFLLSIIERIAYEKSDLIVGTMPNLVEHVKTVTKKHPPVKCIPMGIDIDISDNVIPLPQEFRETYLDSKYFNVVYAGTIGITNALEPFLEAAKELQNFKNIRFILIGDGALKKYFAQNNKLPNLLFAPKIKRNMVQSALEQADLLYFSTYDSKVWKYGLSLNKLIDYMKAGKPIIASYSGYQSMINEAECGEFVSSYDTGELVKTIIKFKSMSQQERSEIGARGKKWLYKNRDYRTLAKNYSDLIASL